MSRYKLFIISVLIVLISCSEDDIIITSCIPSSEYYFSGMVDDEMVCINDKEGNYQIHSGAGYNWDKPAVGEYDLGFETYPFEIGDKYIFIKTPTTEISNKEKVLSLFPIGKLSDIEKEDFLLEYGTVIDKEVLDTDIFHPVREKLTGEFSELEVVSIDEKSEDIYKIELKFSCNLYDDDGIFQGEINSAVIILRLVIQYTE